jgi:hypothetical protein
MRSAGSGGQRSLLSIIWTLTLDVLVLNLRLIDLTICDILWSIGVSFLLLGFSGFFNQSIGYISLS